MAVRRGSLTARISTVSKCKNVRDVRKKDTGKLDCFSRLVIQPVYSNRSHPKHHSTVNEITKVQYLLPAYCIGDTYVESCSRATHKCTL